MWEDEDFGLSPAKSSGDWDSGGLPRTFRHALRATDPLSLMDLDMWDTRSHFKEQSSAWRGTSVSGSEFLSKVSSSSSGINGSFRQSDPGVRRWQSLSRLAPEGASRTSPGAELRAALEESGFRRAELVQRLRQAHERLDGQTDQPKVKDTQLQHNMSTAQLLDMKHKQLAEAVSALEQEKEAAELSRFEENRHRGELQEKILQLEMDMLKMKSTLERGSIVQPASIQRAPNPLSRTLPVTQEDFYREEKQKAERELCKLREVLRETEERAETLAAERDHALQQFHSSKEAQRTLLSQVEEMNQRLSCTKQSQSEVLVARSNQDQASLEKDLLTTRVKGLEDSIEDLKAKLSAALLDKEHLIQEKADLHQRAQGLELELDRVQRGREQLAEAEDQNSRQDQEAVRMQQELTAVREVNEKLTCELEMVVQRLETSQTLLQELTAERALHTSQIAALEAERSQLTGEKEELLLKQEELTELRESQRVLEGENQTLQDHCLCLEAEVLEREEQLHLKVEEHRRIEAERAQSMEKMRMVAKHWTEKWQDAAMALNSAQGKLEELKRDPGNKLREEATRLETEVGRLQTARQKDKEEMEHLLRDKTNVEAELQRVKKESDSLLRVELDARKQELELERSRSQALLHRWKGKGNEAVQTLDKETVTEHSMPPQISTPPWLKPSESDSRQNNIPQEEAELVQVKAELQKAWDTLSTRDSELEEQQQELLTAREQVSLQSSELERLQQQLAEREQVLRGRERALQSLEKLTVAEKTEAQIKISALELKLLKAKRTGSGGGRDDGDQTSDSLKTQLEESRRRASQLEQEKNQAVQRLQTLRQLHQVKDEKPSSDSKTDKTGCLDNQRRMVAEQLKSLFKEREHPGKVYDNSSEAQSGGSSLQEQPPRPKVIKNAVDTLQNQRSRQHELKDRGSQQGAGLSSVIEEQEEEDPDWPAGGGGEQQQEEGQEVARPREELHNRSQKMSTMNVSRLRERDEPLLRVEAKLRFQQQMQSLRATAPPQLHAERSSDAGGPRQSDFTRGGRLHGRMSPHYSDGIYLASLVEICSPDEEEEEEDRRGTA